MVIGSVDEDLWLGSEVGVSAVSSGVTRLFRSSGGEGWWLFFYL